MSVDQLQNLTQPQTATYDTVPMGTFMSVMGLCLHSK